MDNQTNVGSYGSAIGGSSALVEAAQRRGIDISAMQQTSPAAAGGAPVPAPLPEDGMQAAQAALPQATGQPQPTQPDSDVTIATKALATMVTNDSKMKKDLVTMRGQGVA